MFDKEIVKQKLKDSIIESKHKDFDFDQIVDAYTIQDGFYVFRVGHHAFFFTDNELMDACPGYYLL